MSHLMSETWRSQTCESCGERMVDIADPVLGVGVFMCDNAECDRFGADHLVAQIVEHDGILAERRSAARGPR